MDQDGGAAAMARPAVAGSAYPLLPPALSFALGLLAPHVLFGSRAQAAWVFCALLGLCGLAMLRSRRALGGAATLALAFTLGAFAALPLHLPAEPGDVAWTAYHRPGPATLIGRVQSAAVAVPGRVSFNLRVSAERAGDTVRVRCGLVRVAVAGLPDAGAPISPWGPGDVLEVSGWLRPPRDFATPGAASRVAWLARRGVHALLEVKTPILVHALATPRPGLLLRLRERVVAAVDRQVAGGRWSERVVGLDAPIEVVAPSRAAGVLKAMLVDDRALLDDEATRKLAEAGILHILSISGLHVAIVGGTFYLWLGWLTRREAVRAALVLAAVWLYVLVAGSPAPAVRSALVASVVLAGRALYRQGALGNSLALAFLLGGTLEPGGIADPGFQMTYAAAVGLLLLAPRVAAGLGGILPRFAAIGLGASLGAEVFVLPIEAVHFGRVSLAGPLVNLLAVPLASCSVILGFALVLLDSLHPQLARPLGWLASRSVDVLFVVAEPRGHAWSYRFAPAPGWLALLALAAALLVFAPRPLARGARLLPAVLAYAALLLLHPAAPADDSTRVHFLDVGQGDAILVEHRGGGTFLVDAGGFPHSRFDVGDRVVVPFLLARGHRRLDRAAITHAHPDHAAGMLAVLRELSVGELWLGDDPRGDPLLKRVRDLAAARGTREVSVRRGAAASLAGGGEVRVLGPAGGLPAPAEVENSRSLVLTVATPRGPILLTGDVHSDAELGLLAGPIGPAAVLKVAHHGSRTSSDPRFLVAVKPRIAVISCGFDNRFGHPDPVVLERLGATASRVFRTDLDGTVTVVIDAAGHLRVETARTRFLSTRDAR